MEALYHRKRLKLTKKRQREAIDEIAIELVGGTSINLVNLEGLPGGRKCRGQVIEPQHYRFFHGITPLPFFAKDIEGLEQYEAGDGRTSS